MTKLIEFLKKERLYILLLIFVLLINVIVLMYDTGSSRKATRSVQSPTVKLQVDEAARKVQVEKMLETNRSLRTSLIVASLVILLVLFLGAIIDLVLVLLKIAGKNINIITHKIAQVRWNIWDVCKVAVLFAFFGYMLVIIESALVLVLPVVRNNNFRMVVNSSILDALAMVFIIYFTVSQYKEKIVSLGISFKNFFRNVFYGITGYIAAAPVLLLILIATAMVTNFIKYTPEEQEVVKIFMSQKDGSFLLYTVIFAAIIGPVIEEVFFRGFMYTALKKSIGIFWAAVATASLFAMLHAYAVGFVPIMALGLLLVYLYEKTGTLVAPITAHIIHNTGMVLLVFLVKQVR